MTQQVKGGSQSTATLKGLKVGQLIASQLEHIKIYWDLLVIQSVYKHIQVFVCHSYIDICIVIISINWTLVSSITELENAQYHIDFLSIVANPTTDV